MIEFRSYLYYLITAIIIVSIGLYFLKRKALPPYFRFLAGFLLMHLILDFFGFVLSRAHIPNLPLLHLYTLLEFILLSLFYQGILKAPDFLHQNFSRLIPLGALLIIGNTIFFQGPYEFNSFAKTASNISIILFALLYFYNSVLGQIKSPERPALNLINTGFFVFYMGTLLVFLFSDFLRRNDQKALFDIWSVNLVLSLLLQFLILGGLLLATSRSTISPQKELS